MTAVPIVLLVSPNYPPYTAADAPEAPMHAAARKQSPNVRVEIIALSPSEDEFTHLDDLGNLVHRINPARSYLFKAVGKALPLLPLHLRNHPNAFTARVAEKTLELCTVWNRQVVALEFEGIPAAARWLAPSPPSVPAARYPAASEFRRIASVDLVCCTYNRFTDLETSLVSIQREAAAARASGLSCQVWVVHQNPDTARDLRVSHPSWKADADLHFVFASPPGLPRARNVGLAHSRGDLVVFIDDDVVLDPGFVLEHVRAADRHPSAAGVVGRTRSRIEGSRLNTHAAVGQIRFSGAFDTNWDSTHADAVLVPQSPLGANMSFRRETMNGLFGPAWFDERLEGSAHREESTLAVKLFRTGNHLVFAPLAGLFHFEATTGGCENRGPEDRPRLLAHRQLDYLFLHRFYAPLGLAARWGPWLSALRDVHHAPSWKEKRFQAGLGVQAYLEGWRRYRRSKG